MEDDPRIDFLLDQQAKFFAGMEELREQVRQLGSRVEAITIDLADLGEALHEYAAQSRAEIAELRAQARKTDETVAQLTTILSVLVEQHVELRSVVAQQGQQQAELRETVAAQGTQIAELRAMQAAMLEAQRHADERMNALIGVVDGLVRRPPPA
jgi:chromosome segregation ATPase